MGYNKLQKRFKPPTYFVEFSFVSLNALFLKLYSPDAYIATSFFSVLLPLMIYQVISLFGYILKFIQMMHIEDVTEGSGLLTKK